MHRLDLVIGPNGAGKSTFVAHTLAPLLRGSVFVNADEIAKRHWPEDPVSHSYDAAHVAAATRDKLIASRRSFIAETVFSHPSKLDLIRTAHTADYVVVLHILLIPEELAVERVRHRVIAGGHAVPEDKIRSRYRRLWPLARDAAALADTTTCYDNSQVKGPQIVTQLAGGEIVGAPNWPIWTPDALSAHWPV